MEPDICTSVIDDAERRQIADMTARYLRGEEYGEALTIAAQYFIHPVGTRTSHEFLARYLAMATMQKGGSIEGVREYLVAEARYRRVPDGPSDDVIRRQITKKTEGEALATAADIYSVQFLSAWAASARRGGWWVAQIDENQIVTHAAGSSTGKGRPRGRARTESGLQATALKPGKHQSATMGHEFIVATGTVLPEKATFAIALERRRPIGYREEETVERLMRRILMLGPPPGWVCLDRGFSSYAILYILGRDCARMRRLGSGCFFIMPAIKSRSSGITETSIDNALAHVRAMCESLRIEAKPIGKSGIRYAVMEREVKGHAPAKVNMVVFYIPREEAIEQNLEEWMLDDDMLVFPFFTDHPIENEDDAVTVWKAYGTRWNIENFFEKLTDLLGIIPSDAILPRVVSYALGASHLNTWGMSRFVLPKHLRGLRRNVFLKCAFNRLTDRLLSGTTRPEDPRLTG